MNNENTPDENARKTAPEVTDAELLSPEADPDETALKAAPPEADLPEDDDNDMPDDIEEASDMPEMKAVVMPSERGLKRIWHGYSHHKKWTLPLTILVLLAAAIGVPQSRYPLLGTVLQRDYAVQVLDQATHQPVTNADVILNGTRQETDNHGRAHFHVNVGQRVLTTGKKYYRTNKHTVLVAAWGNIPIHTVYLQATGRQVPISVTDQITGRPVENALVRAADTEARTDKDGHALLVLPTNQPKLDAKLTADGYNNLRSTITVTAKDIPANRFALTPAGKVYFLSNLSGKIDVVKTNLDGSGRQTVLAGTGNESDHDTQLMQTSDWKYLALKAKRSPDPAKLYVINTANDQSDIIDDDNADFTPVGWVGHHFVYVVNRRDVLAWKPYAQALKTYDADTGKVTIIDQTTAEGNDQFDYGFNSFSQVYVIGNELVYAKNWYGSGYAPNHLDGKQVVIISAQADGSGKHTIKDFPVPKNTSYAYVVDFSRYQYDGLYVRVSGDGAPAYFVYQDGKLTSRAGMNDDKYFGASYSDHFVSADGAHTFWADTRDGKSAIFVGDQNGQNEKQIALLDRLYPYDWFGNDYLLLYNDKSELYVLSSSGGTPKKVTDFRLPDQPYDHL
ncbi:MAG TPA: hypothetical protein VFL85_04255 [Candidatus Saccharimonadales bacterium]|nr:hypothetical protein [Candidatus Saccharimonadales bacterium]